MNQIIWYKCPNCYQDGCKVFIESIVECKIEGCETIACSHCFIDHLLYSHSKFVKKLSDVDLEKYRIERYG